VSLTQAVKGEARRLGFILAGITTPDPPPHWSVYQHWLALERHGTMNYLDDPRRADPRLLLPECRSILVLALRYPNPVLNSPLLPRSQQLAQQRHGSIAAYAWGRDYHTVIPERLKTLATFIETRTAAPLKHRGYTDTGPLLERELAQRSGLGWIGKNTCLINPGIGSFFLLAEMLLGIELEMDNPFTADRCGSCSRCIAACPTGSILPDRTIDARRCVSYLTIENRNEIPSDLRAHLGNKVFGCDICQQVCPWNRFAEDDHDPAFDAQPGISNPVLVKDLALTPQEFNRKFKENPVLRSKRRGYLRNVAVALGNLRDPAAVPALEKAVQSNEPLIREHAAWALEQIQAKESCPE
jgi:epoxyqueuosine reductase